MEGPEQPGGRLRLQQWHTEAGLKHCSLSAPAPSVGGRLCIVVDGRNSEAQNICLTLSSVLRGTVQRVRIQILAPQSADSQLIAGWVANEPQISMIQSISDVRSGDDYLMVLPAGVIAGTHSVEAAVECLEVTGASVLRVVVDGVERSVEVWRTDALGAAGERRTAEARARGQGSERWTSGASTGMHAAGRPAPRMYLRKGPAERFDMEVLVYDTAQRRVKENYENRVRQLEAQLARAKREAANPAVETLTPRILRVVKRGPRYVARRTKAIMQRRSAKWLKR